jgi:hypothetical protein
MIKMKAAGIFQLTSGLFCAALSALLLSAAVPVYADSTLESFYADNALPPPRWSLEFKYGEFTPDIEDWETYFGDESTKQIGFGFAYKIFRWFEAGLEGNYIRDKGQGYLPLNDTLGGDVTYNLYPAHAYVLLRGIFFEDQWVVPYIGGGYSKVWYRQEIDNQGSSRGNTDGNHVRGGIQILLDWIDPGGAAAMESDSAISNTYLVIEAQRFSAELDGIELGGDSVMVGLLFEF